MTPSKQCKEAGLKSLAEFARITGESKENLINWHRDRPLRFEILLIGAVNYKPCNKCKHYKQGHRCALHKGERTETARLKNESCFVRRE